MKRRNRISPIAAAVLFAGLCFVADPLPAAAQAPPRERRGSAGGIVLADGFSASRSDENGRSNKRAPETNRLVRQFPPEGVEIVAWYVMMGIGQVVILRVPAEKLRETNRVIEQTAWGGYRTEFYPTYDFKPVWDAIPHQRP